MKNEKKFVRNKEEKIKIIYDTFLDLLREKGYNDISTNHIAEIAPVSLGTIYRYFPEGKVSIARDYFEHIKDQIVNDEFFLQVKSKNLPELFKFLISRHIKIYRENFDAFLAYEQTILSNRELLENYRNSIYNFAEDFALKIRKEYNLFNDIPKKQFIKRILFIYNFIEAINRRHLLVFPMFQTDDELISFLVKTILSTTIRD